MFSDGAKANLGTRISTGSSEVLRFQEHVSFSACSDEDGEESVIVYINNL